MSSLRLAVLKRQSEDGGGASLCECRPCQNASDALIHVKKKKKWVTLARIKCMRGLEGGSGGVKGPEQEIAHVQMEILCLKVLGNGQRCHSFFNRGACDRVSDSRCTFSKGFCLQRRARVKKCRSEEGAQHNITAVCPARGK